MHSDPQRADPQRAAAQGAPAAFARLRCYLWPLLLTLSIALSVSFPLTNTDIWWHLAAGRQMVQDARFFYQDPFSLGAAGQPWIDLHWLFQLGAYGVYQLGGVVGLVVAKTVIVCGAALLLLRAAAPPPSAHLRASAPLAVLIIATLIYGARHLVLARPIVLTLLFLSVFLLLLERFRRNERPLPLLWLLPVQLLWANAQGLFVLGPMVVAIYALAQGLALGAGRWGIESVEQPRSGRGLVALFVAIAALFLACLVTPYGWQGLKLPFALFGRIEPGAALYAANVSENVPPWRLEALGGIGAMAHFKWVGALAFASCLLTLRRFVLPHFALLVAFFGLALLAQRNVLLFYWAAGLVVPLNLRGLVSAPRGGMVPKTRPALLTGLALVGLALLAYAGHRASRDEDSIVQPAPFRLPTQSVAKLQALTRSGQIAHGGGIFNSVRYGGYLIWTLFPARRPFIDGRLIIRTPAQFAEHLDLADRPRHAFDRFRQRYDIRLALLPTAYPQRYLPLVVHLYRDPRWQLVDTDGTETLFHYCPAAMHSSCAARSQQLDLGQPALVSRLQAQLRRRYPPGGTRQRALHHLGRLLAEVGERKRAIEVLQPLLGATSQALLARVHYLAGDAAHAQQLSRQILRAHPHDLNSLLLLARIALSQGQGAQALGYLRRCLRINPHHRPARRLLDQLERAPGGHPAQRRR